MELKDGYKKTEIGILPADWKLESYGNVFQFQKTAAYSRSQIFESGDIQYLHYGDIHTKLEHFLDFEIFELSYIKNEQLKTYSLIKEGDLIMADASEDYDGIGKSVEIKNINIKRAISGLHTFLLRGNNELITNGFKGYLHSNKLIKNQFNRLASGLKVYGISKNNLKMVIIPLPPLNEQQAIAEVLSDTDSLIQALEKQIAKKRLIKQGAMQKLLTPKEGWKEKTIEELTLPKGLVRGPFGGALKKEVFVAKGIKVYEQKNAIYKNMSLGQYYIDEKKYIELQRFEIQNGDFIVSCSGTIGRIFQVPKTFEKGIINQALLKITINPVIIKDSYFYHYFSWDNFQEKIIDSTQGGAMKNLVGMIDFKKTLIQLPSLEVQEQIANTITNMDLEIETLERKLSKYKQVKQGLMQNLLSGKIRLTS